MLVKSSVARGIRNTVEDLYPELEEDLDEILPKKESIVQAKCHNKISVYCRENRPLFFQERDREIMPTLRLLHQYPNMMPRFQVDRGAIKHILSGANCMCPGLTSPGGSMVDVEAESAVAIYAEGKEHALGIGITLMSTNAIRETNSGIALEVVHFLGDGLWDAKQF